MFMGGKHVTFNMALWDREFAAAATSADLNVLISLIRSRAVADVLAMTRQPRRWHQVSNPTALLPNQPSVNGCPVLAIEPGAASTARVSNSLRRRLKGKERKLQALPGYRYHLATDEAEINRLLDWFFRIKPLRMAEQNLPDVFAEPGVGEFIRDSCLTKLAGGGRAIELHALECDEEVIALYAGVADGHRFSMMFNTYTMSENSRYSPGLILVRNIIDHYAEQSYRAIDLGIGRTTKRMFCKDDEAIFDSFVPLTARGAVAAAAMSAKARAKHRIKQSRTLFRLAQRLRGALHQAEAGGIGAVRRRPRADPARSYRRLARACPASRHRQNRPLSAFPRSGCARPLQRRLGDHDGAGVGAQSSPAGRMRRRLQHDVIIDAPQRIDRKRQPRRLQQRPVRSPDAQRRRDESTTTGPW